MVHSDRAGGPNIRLSRPGAAELVGKMAESLGDRIDLAANPDETPPPGGSVELPAASNAAERARSAAAPGTLSRMLGAMSDTELLELTRHALDAALEALDTDPALASTLLPSTASLVRAQIARGCVVERDAAEHGYMVAEIDITVWEQLLQADRRSAPIETLDPDETADRKRLLLEELAIDIDELHRFRKDERVVLALRDLGS